MEAVINDCISRKLVQERFGIVMDDLGLIPGHFDGADPVCAHLRSRAGGRAGRAGGRG